MKKTRRKKSAAKSAASTPAKRSPGNVVPFRLPKLEPKPSMFVREYLKDLNGAAAYRRAGYKAKTDQVAASGAHDLLIKPDIAVHVAYQMAMRSERINVDADKTLQQLCRFAFMDPAKMFSAEGALLELQDMDYDTRQAIASIEFQEIFEFNEEGSREHVGRMHKIRFVDKLGATNSIAKHLGMFPNEVPLQITFTQNVVNNIDYSKLTPEQLAAIGRAKDPAVLLSLVG